MSIFSVFSLLVLVSLTSIADIVKSEPHEQVIESLHIKSDIQCRFAITRISQIIRNKASVTQLIRFAFKIPYGALLQSLRAIVAGKQYDAQVVRCQDPNYNKTNRLPGLGKTIIASEASLGRDGVSFNVYVAGNSSVTFTLSYQQQLHRYNHSYEHEVILPLELPLEKVVFEAEICENKGVTGVKTPRLHPKDPRRRSNMKDFSSSCIINHIRSREIATLRCRSKLLQSFQGKWYARFALQYAVKLLPGGRDIVKEGDYFAFFMAPEMISYTLPNNAPGKIPRDVICIINIPVLSDIQVGTLFIPVIYSLDPPDRLNIIRSDEYTLRRSFKPSLVQATDKNMFEAFQYIKMGLGSIYYSREKNVNLDLLAALEMMNSTREGDWTNRARMIILFTDTHPTLGRGNVDADRILRNVARANENLNVSIYSIAVGHHPNVTFLQSLSQRNYGFVRHLPDTSDIETEGLVHRMFHELHSIIFTNLRISFQKRWVRAIAPLPWFPIVLDGTEIKIFGKLLDKVEGFNFTMEAVKKDGEEIRIAFAEKLGHLSGNCRNAEVPSMGAKKKKKTSGHVGILENIWAFASLTQLIAQLDKYQPKQLRHASIYTSIVDLATKYKLVTPFTRMVFTSDPDSTYKAVNCSSRISNLNLLIPTGPTPSRSPVPNTKPTHSPKKRAELQKTPGVKFLKCATLRLFTVAILTPQDRPGLDKSICIIPWQWGQGKFLIFSNPGKMDVTLLMCQNKACPHGNVWRVIRFQAGAHFALVRAYYVNGWVYKATDGFQVKVVSKNELAVWGFGQLTRIYRLGLEGRQIIYKFYLRQNESPPGRPEEQTHRRPAAVSYGGVSGELLSFKREKLRKMATDQSKRMCRYTTAGYQVILRAGDVPKFAKKKARCKSRNKRKQAKRRKG